MHRPPVVSGSRVHPALRTDDQSYKEKQMGEEKKSD